MKNFLLHKANNPKYVITLQRDENRVVLLFYLLAHKRNEKSKVV